MVFSKCNDNFTNLYLYISILGAMKEKDIVELLELKHISGRLCTIQGTSAITGAGIHKALDNILRFRHHMESARG